MKIIEAANVDLIEPFPITEAKRVFKWLRAYKNIIESDLSPKTPEEFEEYFKTILPHIRSFGVIDKNSALGFRHEAPLIGMVVFEPATVWNCYLHIASNRRAWGTGFMDEAVRAGIAEVFASTPNLLRVSAYVLAKNGPVKGMARRLGFTFEGLLRDLVTQRGEPRNVIHFGYTRADWQAGVGQGPTEAVRGPVAEESNKDTVEDAPADEPVEAEPEAEAA